MTGTELDIRQKTDQVVATLNHPGVVEQIKESLPENVSLDRFKRIAITAIRSNADLVTADQTSLFASIVRCAQDGLYPDNREAALVIFKGKVTYMPMVAGLRKIAAEHGWVIRTAVVYEADEFEYELGLEPRLVHHPARPGIDRGKMLYAYAIGVHRSGRKEFEVMTAEEIDKVRQVSRAKDKGPWVDWTERMWEKTSARRLFSKLSLDPNDARLARILEEAQLLNPADAAEQLYGPESVTEHVDLETGEITAGVASPTDTASTDDGAASSGGSQQAATAVPPAAVAVPGDDDEPEPGPATTLTDELAEAARIAGTAEAVGNYKSMTIQQVHMLGDEGAEWFSYVLRHPAKYDDAFYAAVETFVQGLLPELYAVHVEWLAAREAA